jgi:hypothetical protein
MKNKTIDTGAGFSAHVEISDLEKLGWNFDDVYESVARNRRRDGMYAEPLSREQMKSAEKWEKKNYHVRIYNTGKGIRYVMSHNQNGDTGEGRPCGDEKSAHEDVQKLYQNSLLWELCEKDPYYGYEEAE